MPRLARMSGLSRVVASGALLAWSASASHAAFDLVINFSGGTTQQRQAFTNAEAYWENLISGYQTGISVTGITISAVIQPIDGVGNVLGSAGPTSSGLVFGGVNPQGQSPTDPFVLATTGSMRFDSADVPSLEANGSFGAVVLHEMAHVMGFGTLWNPTDNNGRVYNNVYTNGTGQFRGLNALAAYRTEFNLPLASFVPVELGGGSGTANGHWDEETFGGTAQGSNNRELMTGFLDFPTTTSRTTIESFRDIGFLPRAVAVPEPGTFGLLAVGLVGTGGILCKRRRRA